MHLFGSEGEFFFFFSFSRERDALDPALPTEAPRGPCSAEESDRLKQSLCKKYKNTTKKTGKLSLRAYQSIATGGSKRREKSKSHLQPCPSQNI